jgi:guanylate kinase
MNKTIIISSPSGCGKDTIVRSLLSIIPNSKKIITCTTRRKREGEVHGISYYYVSRKEFLDKIENNEFIEWQDVFGELYGISKKEMTIKSRYSFIILDVLGALRLKKIMGGKPFLIFLKPPTKEILIKRLHNRGSDSKEEIEKRLERYNIEVEMSELFDVTVINDDLDKTISKISTLIECYEDS